MRSLLVGSIAILAAGLLPLGASAGVPASQPPSLIGELQPETARDATRADHWRDGLLATYRMGLDLSSLKVDDSSRHKAPYVPPQLLAQLPGHDQPVTFNMTTIYEGTDGVVTYSGTVDGDEGSLVTVSVQGDEVLGKIHTQGLLYLVEGQAVTGYSMSVIDSSRLPKAEPLHEQPYRTRSSANRRDLADEAPAYHTDVGQHAPQANGGVVSVLVLYTPAVAARNNISLLANNVIAQTNASMAVSGVDSSNYVIMADLQSLGDNLGSVAIRVEAA